MNNQTNSELNYLMAYKLLLSECHQQDCSSAGLWPLMVVVLTNTLQSVSNLRTTSRQFQEGNKQEQTAAPL